MMEINSQENSITPQSRFSNLKILTNLLGFIIISWVIIHGFAFLGVFFALAYPIWYAFFPDRTICLLCRFRIPKKTCPICGRDPESDLPLQPRTFRYIALNSLIILVFSVFSFGIVYLEQKVLNYFGIIQTPQTVSFIIPTEGNYKIGEVFPMEIKIVGIDTPINVVQADVTYDNEMLEVLDILTEDSFAEIFVQKSINNDLGYARLSGGIPNPGYTGGEALFGEILFRAKSQGVTEVEFLPSSLVLANNGRATNVLKGLSKASYIIQPEELTNDEIQLQTEVLNLDVLGEKSDKTKLEFYDESEAEVLGIDSTDDLISDESFGRTSIWESLEKLDSMIIDFWGWIKDFVIELFT